MLVVIRRRENQRVNMKPIFPQFLIEFLVNHDNKIYRCRLMIYFLCSDNCWFCLSSPDVDKSLIVAVGKYCYLALAKGGLVSHHYMILPIHHYQTSLDLEKEAADGRNSV